jgi:hypothetical protein
MRTCMHPGCVHASDFSPGIVADRVGTRSSNSYLVVIQNIVGQVQVGERLVRL